MSKVSLADVLELSVSERIRLAQDIWDSVANLPQPIRVTESQREELDRRLDDYHQHPEDGISWETLKGQILGRG